MGETDLSFATSGLRYTFLWT